jgi:putative SOS response-associated peptidase YedK
VVLFRCYPSAAGRLSPIHDRMPVVLDKADIGSRLSGDAATELRRRALAGAFPVHKWRNRFAGWQWQKVVMVQKIIHELRP